MMLEDLRCAVAEANRALVEHQLVTLTWGNVSGIDRDKGLFAIKPSGVPYDRLSPGDIVLVDMEGRVADGALKPSSDTPTHLRLYQRFGDIGGVTHTHSAYATALSQARVELPCLGTTHADHFMGTVPCTRQLTPDEVDAGYEIATGDAIVERFQRAPDPLDPTRIPAVLVAGHAPFTWGKDASESVTNSVALEACARMAILSGLLPPGEPRALEPHILKKHHDRKHGPGAYYGQTHRPGL